MISTRGSSVERHHREPRSIAEQRDFLLGQAEAAAALFLDDDAFMEPYVVESLLSALEAEVAASSAPSRPVSRS